MVLETVRLFNVENVQIKIDTESLEQVDEIKCLGIILHTNLNLSKPFDYIWKKLGKKIGQFSRFSGKLSHWSRRIVYNSKMYYQFAYSMSLLLYCIKEYIKRIQILPNRVMRILFGCNKYKKISEMTKKLLFLNIEQMIEESNFILLFKIGNRLFRSYLQYFLTKKKNML